MTTLRTALLVALASSTLVGCVDDGVAPEGARLLLPDTIRVNWDEGFNGVDDGIGTLVPVDLMVYEGTTGESLEMVDIRFAILAPAAEILASADVESVVRTAGSRTVGSRTAGSRSEPESCTSCVWDAGRDRYLTWRAGTSSAQTDDDGLARVYVWVDAFPVRGGELLPVEVAVDLPAEDGAVRSRVSRGAFQIVAD